MGGAAKWDYRSFKCDTPIAVKEKMGEMRREGWRFHLVMKTEDGFALQVKRRKEGE
jgi:hypothetical protein